MTSNINRKLLVAAAAVLVLVPGLVPSPARGDDVSPVCQPVKGYNDKCPRWVQHVEGPVNYVYKSTAQAVSPLGDRVYVTGVDTGYDGNLSDGDWVTAGFDQATGVQAWVVRYASDFGVPDVPHSVSVSPDGRQVYVTGVSESIGGSRTVTVAYAASTGFRLWLREAIGGSVDGSNPIAVSPDGARVYVQSAKTVAYDAFSGEPLWEAAGATGTSPVSLTTGPDGARLYALADNYASGASTVVAYDAATGGEVWAATYGRGSQESFAPAALAADGSRVYVAGSASSSDGGDYLTLAYDAVTGSPGWSARYDGGASDTGTALVVAGGRVYVTGASGDVDQAGVPDYATVAYAAATGDQQWVARHASVLDGAPGVDWAEAVSASPDGNGLYVTGRGERPLATFDSGVADALTVAYDPATGTEKWAARYNGSPTQSDFTSGLAVGVSPDSHRVFTTAALFHSSNASKEYAVMAYDAYADSPAPTATPTPEPAPRSPTDPVEGSFSLMSLAHSYPSAAGPAVQWDGVSAGGPYRYNSNACSETSPINNIATNLTTYNSLLPGSASPASTRLHGFEFSVTGGSDGQNTLTGTMTLVACKRSGGSSSPILDPIPDAERPRITLAFTVTAEKMSQRLSQDGGVIGETAVTSREVRFDGEATITGGTGVYADLTGAGRIHGYLMCFVVEGVTAGDCGGGLFRDVGHSMTGWYRDPTVPELGVDALASATPPPGFASSPPEWSPGPIQGSFGLDHMIHTQGAYTPSGFVSAKPWDGSAAGSYVYNSRPCRDRAPINDISTNLTTYNSRLPGSASPASTRNHSFQLGVPAPAGGEPAPIEGTIALVACQRSGGPTASVTPDEDKPRIFVGFSGTAERTTAQEVRFAGEFEITGGTGVYEGISGAGRIHGYLFCFNGAGTGGGGCRNHLLDGQYTMTGWYRDPSVAELGVDLDPTTVAFTDRSASSGQYGDEVVTQARLSDDQGRPIPGAELTYELAGEEGSRSSKAVTDVNGVATTTTALAERPGSYRLSVRYAGQSGTYVDSSATTAFTVNEEETVTSLSVEGRGAGTALVARLVDHDSPTTGVPGRTVAFFGDGALLGHATTDDAGYAVFTPFPPSYSNGPHLFEAVFSGDDHYLPSRDQEQT